MVGVKNFFLTGRLEFPKTIIKRDGKRVVFEAYKK